MASLINLKNGVRVIQIVGVDGVRKYVRLGKITKKQAETVELFIEDLAACKRSGTSPKSATSEWVADLHDAMRHRLERAGLIRAQARVAVPSLKSWVRGYIDRRAANSKPNTLLNYEADYRSMAEYFCDKRLDEITPDDAEAFRSHLKAEKKLGEATIRRRCKRLRQFFKAAIRSKLIAENPFADIVCSDFANSERQRFVNREEIQAVLDACPDAQWRMIVALCRYGGLRCPSEVLGLTWADVDWEKRRFRVHAPKTEHHADGGDRIVPLFPELYPYLLECFEQAQAGEKHVITRYRGKNQNLRTQLQRIIVRAGLEAWPRLFHNLRASRQTELEQDFPGYVVAKWIGNSESVARKHYLMLTEDHFQRAAGGDEKAQHSSAKAQQKAQQRPPALGCAESREMQKDPENIELCGAAQNNAARCVNTGPQVIPPRGIEPLSPG